MYNRLIDYCIGLLTLFLYQRGGWYDPIRYDSPRGACQVKKLYIKMLAGDFLGRGALQRVGVFYGPLPPIASILDVLHYLISFKRVDRALDRRFRGCH